MLPDETCTASTRRLAAKTIFTHRCRRSLLENDAIGTRTTRRMYVE